MRKTIFMGYLALMMAQIFFAGNLIINKYLLMEMDMFVFLIWRFVFATLGFALMFILSKSPWVENTHPEGRLTRGDVLSCASQGLLAGLFFNVIFSWGLQKTTATAAGIICSTLPVVIAVLAVWLLKERLGRTKIIALSLAMLGILIINMDQINTGALDSDHSVLGDALVFLAIIPEAMYCILSRKLAGRVTPLGSALLTNFFATLLILPFGIYSGALYLSDYSVFQFGMILLASLCSIIFYWGCAWGLSITPASTAGLFAGVLPVASTTIAIFFLGEPLRWLDVGGMVLVLLSIVIGTKMHLRWRRKESVSMLHP